MASSSPIVTTSPVRDVDEVLIQTANTLPQDDDGWTTLPAMRYEGASEDIGQQLGELLMRQNFGRVTFYGSPQFKYIPDPEMVNPLGGQIIRALIADDDGDVTVNGDNYTAFWWGVVLAPSTNPDGAAKTTGGQGEWRCVSIASVLGNIEIGNGYVVCANSSNPATPGRCPPFNDHLGGDMSATKYQLPNGVWSYIHDLTVLSSGNYWTAAAILNLLLNGFANPNLTTNTTATGFTWVVNDPSNCLAYIPPTIDLDAMTVLQAINDLISEARGLTWWTTVADDGTCTINVSSVFPETIAAPNYTVPAAVNIQTVSIIGESYFADVNITQDYTEVYDKIVVRGNHPWVGFTVNIENGATQKPSMLGEGYGWATGSQTQWAAYPEGWPTVWRRFQIDNTWLGGQYALAGGKYSNGLRNQLTVGTLAINGAGGLDGTRTWLPSASTIAPGFMVRGERMVPPALELTSNTVGPNQPPMVFRSYAGQTGWADVTRWYIVEVQDYPLAVVVDDGKQGKVNQAIYNSGEALLVTLGVREIEPLQVSWVQAPGSTVNGSPRVKIIDMPQCEQWIVLSGTVKGVDYDSDSATVDGFQQIVAPLAVTSSDTIIRDDTPILQTALALVIPWLTLPAVTCRWTDRGVHDVSDTLRSGTLLSSFIRGDGTVTANGLIRRSWSVTREQVNGKEMVYHSTQYTTRRVAPNYGTVVASIMRSRT